MKVTCKSGNCKKDNCDFSNNKTHTHTLQPSRSGSPPSPWTSQVKSKRVIGARLSIGTTMGPQQPPPMLSPAREATSSSTVQMTTQSLSLQSAASIAQVQYPMASSLALHSPSMVKACCKSGCSYSLDLRPCRCGHHFHHICTTDEDGKLCACCYTPYPFL
eukprot:scpid97531/ scgid0645/ 